MTNEKAPPTNGQFNTLYGNIDAELARSAAQGHGNTVVGATDNNGNTILTTPMSVGYEANGGSNGIAVGAFAGPRPPKKAGLVATDGGIINAPGATISGWETALYAEGEGSSINATDAAIEGMCHAVEQGQIRLDNAFIRAGLPTEVAAQVREAAEIGDTPGALTKVREWAIAKFTDPQQVNAIMDIGVKLLDSFSKAS